MKVVVDANIIFAVLIKEAYTSHILFNNNLEMFIPNYVFLEFEEHKEELFRKTKREKEDVLRLLDLIKRKFTIVPDKDLFDFARKAEEISPDEGDIHYFALALKLNCPIWTNDKKLKQQDRIKIYHTHEIAELLSK